jgi:hypothetical protein
VDVPLGGDGVVSVPSALHRRPAGTSSYVPVQNPPSAWHADLPWNREIIGMVHDMIRAFIAAHPAPVQVAPAPAPALGGDAYWLAGGGTWYVHSMQIQISRGASGLAGAQTWNAGGNIQIGHAQLAFTSNADGSLTGRYTATGTYTYTRTPLPGFIPEPDADLPQQGQAIRLVPVSPHLAKSVYDGNSPRLFVGGNTNLCQDGLADASQYCGA